MDRNGSRQTKARLRRPRGIECLESRMLLSAIDRPATLVAPIPAAAPSPPSNATDFDAIIGASAARSLYKVDGEGLTVAVIDTGVNYNHDNLGGGLGPGHKVVAGFDFSNGSGDPNAVTWQHGTAVAGLIAGSEPGALGVAPGADVVALRVFGNDNKGDFTRVADALQWVVDNHAKYHISVANLSISDGSSYTRNWFADDNGVGQRITGLIRRLSDLNIPVVTATGNNFTGHQGVGFTSIVADSISVTATDASDRLVATAQRLGPSEGRDSATDLAAPGVGLYAPIEGDGYTIVDGTSFAAPLVSGGILLLQQIYRGRFGRLPKVADVDAWLTAGAVKVRDDVTGLDIGRINIPKAASLIPNPAAQTTTPPAPPVNTLPIPPANSGSGSSTGNGGTNSGGVGSASGGTTSTGTGTGGASGASSMPPPSGPSGTLQVFYNGRPVDSAQSGSLLTGWAGFLSSFKGTISSIRGWTKSGPVAAGSSSSTSKGLTLSKVQAWGKAPAPTTAVKPRPAGSVKAMSRPWHSGFAGRRHRA